MAKQYKESVMIGLDKNGKPIYKWATGYTKRDLHISIARILAEAGLIGDAQPTEQFRKRVPNVKDFIRKVYYPVFIERLAPTTAENYRQMIHLNIVPFLGDKRMDEVNVATIQQFYDWMASASQYGRQKNLNEKTIERVGGLTSRIFKVAKDMGLIEETPFKSTLLSIRAEKAGHHRPLPDCEVERIKREIPLLENRDEKIYMAFLVYTGMRPEEIRGIRWEDMHLDQSYGVVKCAITYPTNSKPHIGKPKTEHSERIILLTSTMREVLKPYEQKEGFVCGGEQPWCYSRAMRTYRSAFKHLGIVGFCAYDFRTTFATQLKESGMATSAIADLMGHADTRMVETVYARTRKEGVMKHLDALEARNA